MCNILIYNKIKCKPQLTAGSVLTPLTPSNALINSRLQSVNPLNSKALLTGVNSYNAIMAWVSVQVLTVNPHKGNKIINAGFKQIGDFTK